MRDLKLNKKDVENTLGERKAIDITEEPKLCPIHAEPMDALLTCSECRREATSDL
jgi:hypothetical protein